MKFCRGKKVGDTLVEVTIAIGIFSMVAIAIVSVVSGSSSGAQANLETTVAREEIDTQAEALRFIQRSYIAEGSDSSNYEKIWDAITSKALTAPAGGGDLDMSYNPSTCDDAMSKYQDNQFIINYRALSNPSPKQVVLRRKETGDSGKTIFNVTKSIPRLVYTNSDVLVNDNSFNKTNLQSSDGLYILAVKDYNKTTIAEGSTINEQSAYYDFYIRSCWYPSGSNTPSTISTVVRLYDPKLSEEGNHNRGTGSGKTVKFYYNNEWRDGMDMEYNGDHHIKLFKNLKNMTPPVGYHFAFWCTTDQPGATDTSCGNGGSRVNDGAELSVNMSLSNERIEVNLHAIWAPNQTYTLNYNASGKGTAPSSTTVYGGQAIKVTNAKLTYTNLSFKGWCSEPVAVGNNCGGKTYASGAQYLAATPTGGGSATVYAIWKKIPNTISFNCGAGGTVKTGANTTQTVYDNSTNLRSYSNMCSIKANYTFKNWTSTNPAATFADGAVFNKYNANNTNTIVLTAQYTYTNPCTFNEKRFKAGDITPWTVPTGCSGTYQLEVWGAEGGTLREGGSTSDRIGGRVGYTSANIYLKEGTLLYVTVGKQGTIKNEGCSGQNNAEGGFNGGGRGHSYAGACVSGGGGASHISGAWGTLDDANVRSNIYIAAGGGGGVVGHLQYANDPDYTELHGGTGSGGDVGGNSYKYRGNEVIYVYGGGASAGNGLVGKGGDYHGYDAGYGGGGGGGWYGGEAVDGGGGGGSGYVNPNRAFSGVKRESEHQVRHTYEGHIPRDGDAVIRRLGN